FPTLDFAGGTVVHVTSGVSALVCAIYLGRRLGYPREAMPPHCVVLSFVGACLLWVGWFGFNAGSALAAGNLATSAFVATHFAAAAAVNPIFKDAHGSTLPSGLLEGNAHQLLNQFLGVVIAWALAAVGTLIILKIVDATVGLRVSEEHEIQGLDLSQHGEEGYYWG